MGAWDYGIFDDDTAYEFTDEIKDDPKEFFKSSFEHAIGQEYLDYDECHAVTVSAAYMDNLLNGTQFRTDSHEDTDESNVNLFGTLHKDLDVADLKPLAVRALKRVLAENAELNELWSENEELYPKWKQGIIDVMERLQ
jgi:hypothetical protein